MIVVLWRKIKQGDRRQSDAKDLSLVCAWVKIENSVTEGERTLEGERKCTCEVQGKDSEDLAAHW